MSGHLLRCRCAPVLAYEPVRSAPVLAPPCIWPLLNRLQHPNTRAGS